MTYKETLFFVGKCLTISLEEKNRNEIEHQLKTTEINWDSVVKVSTAHFVFPALYCNLKRVNFLTYLPEELVNYMVHITGLNRERNTQIIAQAKEVNTLLLANNITPIFIKGTSNLLENLYEDIGERMVGDIDLFFKKNEAEKAYKILKNANYNEIKDVSEIVPDHRHLPRLVHKNSIAALELHKEILRGSYVSIFNYETLKSDLKLDQEYFLGNGNQLVSIILSKQINDYGYQLKSVYLRSFYDIFLLSKRTNTLYSIKKFPSILLQTNSFLALTAVFFCFPSSIKYEENNSVKNYVTKSINTLESKKRFKRAFIYLQRMYLIFFKAIFNKKYRRFLISRLKPKPNA